MALSQSDRIAISKKIVNIPNENAAADLIKSQLEVGRASAEAEDNANKNLQDSITVLINPYQSELERYDGNGRTQVTEQDMIDSSNRVLQNPFFPNDANTPLPNVPTGGWAFFPAFSGNKAIGKNYDETFTTVTKEQDLIDAINAQVAIIEAQIDATRSTGLACGASGTCNLPQYDNEVDCTGNGGVWAPGPDQKDPDPTTQQALIDIVAAVQAWEDFIVTTQGIISGNPDVDAGRLAENNAAISDINTTISAIDTWQALDDFDVTTSTPGDCASFDALDENDFLPSKLRNTELTALKNAISSRESFIATRIPQIEGHLGTVSQDFGTGDILGGSGFYLQRFRFIDMRLNAIAGSLTALKAAERGQDAQDQFQNANDNAEAALTSVVSASGFRAPALNTSTIHVIDGSLFSPGDSAYVVSDVQQEIAVTISSIDGNRIVLDTVIPEKYRNTDFARLYKEL